MRIEARNHTPSVSPNGQSMRVNAAPTRNAAASPDSTVSRSYAKNWAFWSVKLTPTMSMALVSTLARVL